MDRMLDARLEPLDRHQWPELYRLMVAQTFPGVPPAYGEAQPYFESARMFGCADTGGLRAAFVFGPDEDGIAYLDVVCAPREHGKWATLTVLRSLYGLAFDPVARGGLGLRCLWVQPHGKRAVKACLQAGFVPPGTSLDGDAPVLVMTPHGVPRRYRNDETTKGED